jgi:hypothetical protein
MYINVQGDVIMKIFDKVKSSIKSVRDGAAKGGLKAKSAVSVTKNIKSLGKLNPFKSTGNQ